MNTKFTQSNYTTNGHIYQLHLPLEMEFKIPANDSVRLLGQIIEEMDLAKLYQSYSRHGKNQASPRQLLAILVYAYMNRIYSSRDIECACRRDINFMYLLEDRPAPDYTTIARFRSLHFAPLAPDLMAQMDELLLSAGEISLESLFIDGTKIESFANRYPFVWKRAVIKYLQKLVDKLPDFLDEIEEAFAVKVAHGSIIKLKHLKKLRRKLKCLQTEQGITFVHGIGKRKSPFQRAIETLDGYMDKLKEYNQKIHIAGKRNSYSKTDPDATFMCMKEDHMLNGQLKPGYNLYNLQYGIDLEYVVWATIESSPTDTPTLIPFLKDFQTHFQHKYRNVVADSGYESEENYLYLESQNYAAFIKPSNYEQSKKRKYKKDIGRRENMAYNAEEDCYRCANGKKLLPSGIKYRKSRSGYIAETTQYCCEDCTDCPFKQQCIKGNNSKKPLEERTKHFEVSKNFLAKRAEARQRITTDEGKLLRMNRSIQSEGAFADIKADMNFRRYLCKGNEKVMAESILLALAHNVNKLHHKIQKQRLGCHLHALKQAA